MKGDKFLDDLRTCGMLGLSLTLTGRQCALLARLVDAFDTAVEGDGAPMWKARDEIKRELQP